MTDASAVLQFWFEETESKYWFKKDAGFDAAIRKRFAEIHHAASLGELAHWRESATGRLAEIIVLDQFSRNLYRDDARAFAQDVVALVLAQEAVSLRLDANLATAQKAFLYMPYMHSESLVIHEEAVRLFSQPGLAFNHDFELRHKAIIERFGHYPHRNAVLGRPSTPEELEFLSGPGSSF
jgi:uncharacterized protein (DUF924 family)